MAVLTSMVASDIYAANPYKMGQVDYFRQNTSIHSSVEQASSFDWNEPMIGADGRVSQYTPPAPMLALLENPTPKNAKAYLGWQKQRVQKILKAQEMIDQVSKEERP